MAALSLSKPSPTLCGQHLHLHVEIYRTCSYWSYNIFFLFLSFLLYWGVKPGVMPLSYIPIIFYFLKFEKGSC